MKSLKKKMVITMVLTFAIAILYGYVTAGASLQSINQPIKYKYYSSIRIEEGMSLWMLALRYADQELISHENYIKAIKNINRLDSDTIHAGQYLTFFYYSSELK